MSEQEPELVESSWAGIQRVAATPRPVSYFDGRTGYTTDFLGTEFAVPLPSLHPDIASDAATLADGTVELKYTHFSTIQSKSRRLPILSACNIDGAQTKIVPRHDVWSYDGRIPTACQMLKEAYGTVTEKRFSRGHLTRRKDPNWGSMDTAVVANIDTFFATNACPQWQPFNNGLWGDLEDYILLNAQDDQKKISVFTGPFFTDDDPVRFDVKIPSDFWKVVAFISQQTQQLTAIAYVMSQRKYFDSGVAGDLEDFQTAQVPLALVESRSKLSFGALTALDVLYGADLTFVQPIKRLQDTRIGI